MIEKNRIVTTIAKAKAVRPIVEKMITIGKSGSLADKRRALAYLYKRKTVKVLFDEVAPRFIDRNGGYTRIMRTDLRRKGDGSELAILEFIDYIFEVKEKKSKAKSKDKDKSKGKPKKTVVESAK